MIIIDTIKLAFEIYSKRNFDIVDCMLYAYYKNEDYTIETFDKKLKNMIKA